MAAQTPSKKRLSLSSQVLLALGLGIGMGLFFGELVQPLQIVGRAFILLLQMTVLPYVTLSLITGLGRMTYQDMTNLVLKMGLLLVLAWILVFAVILVAPLTFPNWQSASFFSTTLVEERPPVDFLNLFIPSNPFYSFGHNVVPAVVVFSIAVGVALIGLDNKSTVIEPLAILANALMRITNQIARLTPFGVFAIVASTVGTMDLAEVGRLQIYLLTYAAVALVLTFVLLPAMVTSLTPLAYGQVVGHSRDVLITSFATGSALIVLPLLVERSKELLRLGRLSTDDTESTVEVVVPAFFNFPKMGTLLPALFVLFAGWFSGTQVPVTQYPLLTVASLASLFGSVKVAIPFLLDLFRIPADMFQILIATEVVTVRFTTLLSTMNNLVLALLGACAVGGLLTVRWGRVLRNLMLSAGLIAVYIGAAQYVFTHGLTNAFDKDQIIANMQLLRDPVPTKVFTSPAPLPAPPPKPGQSALQRIRTRGIIRVGYLPDNLPFIYKNATGDLVGFNVEMANMLAHELSVTLEFVPVELDRMVTQLQMGYCDIIMAGLAITTDRAETLAFSEPYLDQTLAFIVQDHRRNDFNSRDAIQRLKAPRIGSFDVPYYIDKVRRYLPRADIVLLESLQEFFENRSEDLDAFVYSAEAGSAWSLLYPAYTVAIPHPDVVKAPFAYAVARGDQKMLNFVNTWITLKQRDRTIESLFDYWILGKNAAPKPPRWSVIRNVLHWVK